MKAKIEAILLVFFSAGLLVGCRNDPGENSSIKRIISSPNFNKDIAPIIFNNCSSCHHAGGVGPFALTNYAQVKSHAQEIKTVTSERIMPPWKAQPGWGEFEDSRRLIDAQIKTISAWVDQGCREGDGNAPEVPVFKDDSGITWTLGKPDLVYKVPRSFSIPATGPDINRCFVLPTNLKEDVYVRAVEIRPSNPKVTHHCVLFLDSGGSARNLDALDPLEGYGVFGEPGFIPSGGLGIWTAGFFEKPLPKGVVRVIKKNSDLVLDTHFHPTGKPEFEQTTVGIHLVKSKSEIKHVVVRISLSKFDFAITANTPNYQSWMECTMPVDCLLVGVAPHSHYLCKEIKAWANRPNEQAEKLINIKSWDFNKQMYYRYRTPVELPKGTNIRAEYIFDNTLNNSYNPYNPPRTVFFGPRTIDEMPIFWFDVVAKNEAERPQLLEYLKKGRQFIYKTSW